LLEKLKNSADKDGVLLDAVSINTQKREAVRQDEKNQATHDQGQGSGNHTRSGAVKDCSAAIAEHSAISSYLRQLVQKITIVAGN